MLLLAMALCAAAWRAPRPAPPAFAGLLPPIAGPGTELQAVPTRIELPQDERSAHASTLLVEPDGAVAIAWFAGSREGASDVRIRMARLEPGVTVDSWVSLTREQLQRLLHRSVRKLGNPVLRRDAGGTLHILVTSVSVGGWSGSAVSALSSIDGGRSWGSARRLVLSPLLNLSTLVRAPALELEDGGVAVPAYHECITKWGLWVRMDRDGRVVDAQRMPQPGPALQPAVAALGSRRAVAALRSGSGSARRVLVDSTDTAGLEWVQSSPLEIPNPDSGVALARLRDGSLLLACNPLEGGRHVLQLFRSRDGGQTWMPGRVIESGDPGAEFSYPALAVAPGGRVHLSYTRNRTRIAVIGFDPDWAEGTGE